MKLILRDKNPAMVDAWRLVFRDADVEIAEGDIFGYGGDPVTADAIISPANSFGFMDGGIDYFYSLRWPHVQGELQELLRRHHYGELPVGQAVALPTGDPNIPWLISAPTMRVPADIQGSVHAYLAFRAALLVAKERGFTSVLSPGMGTAVGRLDPAVAAAQMFQAYLVVVRNQAPTYQDLSDAWGDHEKLRRGVAQLGS